jgi:hypothetical protein
MFLTRQDVEFSKVGSIEIGARILLSAIGVTSFALGALVLTDSINKR